MYMTILHFNLTRLSQQTPIGLGRLIGKRNTGACWTYKNIFQFALEDLKKHIREKV